MPAQNHNLACVAAVLGVLWSGSATAAAGGGDGDGGGGGVLVPSLHAVVVGINSYISPLKPLNGAVADARDIADALKSIGVQPTLLLNKDADRKGIWAALNGMIERAQPGDTVLFTYAGHGGVSERPSADPTEATGRDQLLVLGGATSTAPGNGERIIDDEVDEWSARATAKGLKPVLFFDSCHSGTMYRSLDGRAGLARVRSAGEFTINGPDALSAPSVRRKRQEIRPGVFSYAAVQDNELVTEKPMPGGGYRGAFSIAFAEALRGDKKADRNGDGWLSHGELIEHLGAHTAQMMDSRQNPKMEPFLSARDEKLFPIAASFAPKITAPSPSPSQTPPVRVRVIGPAAAAEQIQKMPSVILVKDAGQAADLVWDAGKREAVSGLGDVVAVDLPQPGLSGLVEKWRALARLQASGRSAALAMQALPDNRARRAGEEVGFAVAAVNGQALTIFNLAGDGTVEFLYPGLADDPRRISGDFRLERFAKAQAPFGTDHLIALTTTEIPAVLHETLKRLNGKPAGLAAADAALTALSADPKGRLGVQAVVTQP